MNVRGGIIAGLVSASALGIAIPGARAGADVTDVCVARTSSKLGSVSWELRQASGLTTVLSSPGVVFTHNDRGIRDHPGPLEDTKFAAVWAVDPVTGKSVARFRLVDSTGAPIPYFDTEAISTDPSGKILLADIGTNIDRRAPPALYRVTPDPVSPGQPFVSKDLAADIIPFQYFNQPAGGSPVSFNDEAFTMDQDGNAWFIARKATLPYSYEATRADLENAAITQNPARAVRSSKLRVNGPMTDASIARVSPTLSMLLVKTLNKIYAYGFGPAIAGIPDVATALSGTPCLIASASSKKTAGYGEAIVARGDGGFYTLAEAATTLNSGLASPIFSFSI